MQAEKTIESTSMMEVTIRLYNSDTPALIPYPAGQNLGTRSSPLSTKGEYTRAGVWKS